MQTVLMTAGKGEKDLDKKQKIYTDQLKSSGQPEGSEAMRAIMNGMCGERALGTLHP